MAANKRQARSETRRKRQYGHFTADFDRQSYGSDLWYVTDRDGDRFELGTGKDGKKRAQSLAAALDAAGAFDLDPLPPCADGSERPHKYGDRDDWEKWTAEAKTVPLTFLADGKPAAAGYLHAVHQLGPDAIARELDVSEQTVRQYLSDLRAGRRGD